MMLSLFVSIVSRILRRLAICQLSLTVRLALRMDTEAKEYSVALSAGDAKDFLKYAPAPHMPELVAFINEVESLARDSLCESTRPYLVGSCPCRVITVRLDRVHRPALINDLIAAGGRHGAESVEEDSLKGTLRFVFLDLPALT